jgi:hypothetical protein
MNTNDFFKLLYENISNQNISNQNVVIENNISDISGCINHTEYENNNIDNNSCKDENQIIKDNTNIIDGKKEHCLISFDDLEDDHIVLKCGHKFNYKPLYYEVYNRKIHQTKYEITSLLINQIKCPYCRNIQSCLLPPRNGFESIRGVNDPVKYCMKPFKCKYIFLAGKNKGSMCNKECFNTYCKKCENIISKRKNENENVDKNENKKNTNIVKCKNTNIEKCNALLKSGKNKGNVCGNKAFENGLCKKHTNYNKID